MKKLGTLKLAWMLREGWDALTVLSTKPSARSLKALYKVQNSIYKGLGGEEAELFWTAPILSTCPGNLKGEHAQAFQLMYSRLMYLRCRLMMGMKWL